MINLFLRHYKKLYNSVFSYIFPYSCCACKNKSNDYLCTDCKVSLNFHTRQDICSICASQFDIINNFDINEIDTRFICNACLENNYAFTHTFALFEHSLKFKTLVYAVKNGNIPLLKHLSKILAHAYQQFLQNNNNFLPNLILPVPISNHKLYARGYNQSLYMAKILSQILHIPYVNNILAINNIKKKNNRTQHLLNRHERASGLEYIINPHSKSKFSKVKGLNILLADDVITTGATLHNIAEILINAGANSVSNIVLAKTPRAGS